MSLPDDKPVIACPGCQVLIFEKNLIRHFQFAHRYELTREEHQELLAEAAKKPVSPKARAAFLKRAEKLEKTQSPIERTPSSMRGWDSNNPGRKVSIGPLGPGKG
jgi:hypothetical protein